MQPLKFLHKWLLERANNQHFLLTPTGLRPLLPELSDAAFKALLSRAAASEVLCRVCRGIYLFKPAYAPDGLLLYHTARLLRARCFNYISLETALSDSGVISQIPINRIMLMSSGRTNVISCGNFGSIEFIHTSQKPAELAPKLIYDQQCQMWRANTALALEDMRRSRRNLDLIDWEVANELI